MSAGRTVSPRHYLRPGPGQPPGQDVPAAGTRWTPGRVSVGVRCRDNGEEFPANRLYPQHLKFINCKSFLVVSCFDSSSSDKFVTYS